MDGNGRFGSAAKRSGMEINMINDYKDMTPVQMRHLIREGKFTEPTSGLCPGYAQANLIVLPKEHAYDFLLFAQRNPKACPVLEVLDTGSRFTKFVAKDCDIAKDFPKYRIYEKGVCTGEYTDVEQFWRDDLVGFLIGCSFSFESELVEAGIEMRHNTMGRNVPMYITGIDTVPAGIFSGKMVVSMRPVPPEGDPAAIGIRDIDHPDFGDPVEIKEGEVTMFWPCGVTPQSVVMNVKPDFAITHAPGHMLILDVKNVDLKD